MININKIIDYLYKYKYKYKETYYIIIYCLLKFD